MNSISSSKAIIRDEYSMEYALDLYPNRALLFDPNGIGAEKWPNRATFPAEINLELTNFFYELISKENEFPVNRILRALYSMTGVLSFNLSFYNLAINAKNENGFFINKSSLLNSFLPASYQKSPDFKDKVAVYGQALLLLILSKFKLHLKLSISCNNIYSYKVFGKIFRLRRNDAIFRVMRVPLSEEDKKFISDLNMIILNKFFLIAKNENISIDLETQAHFKTYISSELERAWSDLYSLRRFFGKVKFDFYERSLTPYQKALIGIVCRENGGQVHSTYHGVCQTASEPDVATMANASIFWGVSEAFTDDAQELSAKIPLSLRSYEIKNMGEESHYKTFIKQDHARDKIKRVAIMGRHIVMRYSAFNSLEFPAYLDLEKNMANLLLANGYDVVYKAHPECEWRHFDKFFDERVHIDWRPFEKVMDEFDAVFYHFGASSTLPHALGSHIHVYMLKDGWHDIKIWPSRIQKFFGENCNMIPAHIGDNGLIRLDKDAALHAFENPVKFDKDIRVKDFFCKRYK